MSVANFVPSILTVSPTSLAIFLHQHCATNFIRFHFCVINFLLFDIFISQRQRSDITFYINTPRTNVSVEGRKVLRHSISEVGVGGCSFWCFKGMEGFTLILWQVYLHFIGYLWYNFYLFVRVCVYVCVRELNYLCHK
jgi:hypothetical protein